MAGAGDNPGARMPRPGTRVPARLLDKRPDRLDFVGAHRAPWRGGPARVALYNEPTARNRQARAKLTSDEGPITPLPRNLGLLPQAQSGRSAARDARRHRTLAARSMTPPGARLGLHACDAAWARKASA